MNDGLHQGFDHLRQYPLFEALFTRRSRRVSRGVSLSSGLLTHTSEHPPQALSPLEEALLIAATGVTGVIFSDHPYRTPDGQSLLPTPLMSIAGGASARPDQSSPAHFFVWNDSGTYLIKHPDDRNPPVNILQLGPDELVAHVERLKVKVLDGRLDFPRRFPFYLGRNHFTSNVPGSTLFVPVIEMTGQYINGLLLLLSQTDGTRPAILDDFNHYRPAGCGKWIRSGFLNRDIKLPLGLYGRARIDHESLLLLQNLALVAAAIGVAGWLHSTFPPTILLGGSEFGKGLGFRFATPVLPDLKLPVLNRVVRGGLRLRQLLRPFPAGQPNPVGLDGHIQAFCPPYYKDMDAAIDAVIAKKVGAGGLYQDPQYFARSLRPELAPEFLAQQGRYNDETVECVRAICKYIYERYGRFPAHVNAIEAPGIGLQVHHPDLAYYEKFFQARVTRAEREHQRLWHGG